MKVSGRVRFPDFREKHCSNGLVLPKPLHCGFPHSLRTQEAVQSTTSNQSFHGSVSVPVPDRLLPLHLQFSMRQTEQVHELVPPKEKEGLIERVAGGGKVLTKAESSRLPAS